MTADCKSVHDIAARLEAAFNASDAVTLALLYSDTAILMPPNEPMVRGRAEIQTWFERALVLPRIVRIVPIETTAEVGQAFQVGTFTTVVASSGKEDAPVPAKYALVLKNYGGEWKIEYDIWSLDQSNLG
jgi:ketosteroid isomerase-like protein